MLFEEGAKRREALYVNGILVWAAKVLRYGKIHLDIFVISFQGKIVTATGLARIARQTSLSLWRTCSGGWLSARLEFAQGHSLPG